MNFVLTGPRKKLEKASLRNST